MRRLAHLALVVAGAAAWIATTAGADDSHTYRIELDNAFGIVEGSEVRIAGVTQGDVTDLDVNAHKRAVLTVEVSGPLSQFGEDTTCSSEPQSLIAEYFIDCQPMGPPLPDGGEVPVEQTTQTVQTDLVQNTLREPYKQRLALIINEFGTALAGNPDNLNEAIRRGAPALRQFQRVTDVLGDQNRIIRGLNEDADRIMEMLAARRDDVVRFVQEARDTAAASAERREDLSRDFNLLDDFLAELGPTMVELGRLAREQTPLLVDLRAAAPQLNRLALNLPAFGDASRVSLDSLGEASVVGRRALSKGRDEIRQLKRTGRKAPSVSEKLADFLRDLDDPGRAVEYDARAAEDTARDAPTGYTGLEGLLNYAYYQPGAINQFDTVGHLLHFSLFSVQEGACGNYATGGEAGAAPTDSEGTTNNILDAARCVSWLGPNQPRLAGADREFPLPPYDPSVCPDGSAAPELCNPAGASSTGRASQRTRGTLEPGGGGGGGGQAPPSTALPQPGGGAPGGGGGALPNLPKPPGGGGLPGLGGGGSGLGGGGGLGGGSGGGVGGLLGWLLGN
jgi:phospholipid/cholesterol/gamma-HCH transport system substrate-binding protein